MKDRKRQRENRRREHREEGFEKKNIFGVKDMTAYNAVQRIRIGRQATLKLASQNRTHTRRSNGRVVFVCPFLREGIVYGENDHERAGIGGADGHQSADGIRPDSPCRLSEHPGGSKNPHFHRGVQGVACQGSKPEGVRLCPAA